MRLLLGRTSPRATDPPWGTSARNPLSSEASRRRAVSNANPLAAAFKARSRSLHPCSGSRRLRAPKNEFIAKRTARRVLPPDSRDPTHARDVSFARTATRTLLPTFERSRAVDDAPDVADVAPLPTIVEARALFTRAATASGERGADPLPCGIGSTGRVFAVGQRPSESRTYGGRCEQATGSSGSSSLRAAIGALARDRLPSVSGATPLIRIWRGGCRADVGCGRGGSHRGRRNRGDVDAARRRGGGSAMVCEGLRRERRTGAPPVSGSAHDAPSPRKRRCSARRRSHRPGYDRR